MTIAADEAVAIKLLEELQERLYRSTGRKPHDIWSDDVLLSKLDTAPLTQDMRDAARAQLKGGGPISIPRSKYDHPREIDFYSEIVTSFRQFLSNEYKDIPPPIIGSAPLPGPNSLCWFPRESSRHIIICQEGQTRFFNAAIAAIVAPVPGDKPIREASIDDLWNGEKWLNHDAMGHVVPLMVRAVMDGLLGVRTDPLIEAIYGGEHSNYRMEDAKITIAMRLLGCVTTFILAHEYGHVAHRAKQTYEELMSFILPHEHKIDIQKVMRNIVEERSADMFGVSLAIRRCKFAGYSLEEGYSGVTLFFDLMRFFEKGMQTICTGSPSADDEICSNTHPPLVLRREGAEKQMHEELIAFSDCKREYAVAASFRILLDSAWNAAMPLFQEWHARGLGERVLGHYKKQASLKTGYTMTYDRLTA